jgi:hypothetical protein
MIKSYTWCLFFDFLDELNHLAEIDLIEAPPSFGSVSPLAVEVLVCT